MSPTITRPRPPAAPARSVPDDQLPPVDPRIRARRVEVRRDAGRRRLRRLVVLGAVVAVVALAVGITQSPLLGVDHVSVRGSRHLTSAAVVEASGLRHGQPLIDLDPGAAARRIEALPWVLRASVARQWPRTVVVRVTERTPIALVTTPRGPMLVDAAGRVLGPAPAGAGGLVHLAAHAAPTPGTQLTRRWDPALRVASALPAALRGQVAAIAPAGDRLRLTDDIDVRLCSTDELPDKVVALDALLRTPARSSTASINLCVPSAPALTPRAGRA